MTEADIEVIRRAYVRGFADSNDDRAHQWHEEHAALDALLKVVELFADLTPDEVCVIAGLVKAMRSERCRVASIEIDNLIADADAASDDVCGDGYIEGHDHGYRRALWAIALGASFAVEFPTPMLSTYAMTAMSSRALRALRDLGDEDASRVLGERGW